MDFFGEIGIEETFEFKFARDLIRYILEVRMTGLHWIPTGVFELRDVNERLPSPFTPQMRYAVNEKLDVYEYYYLWQYEIYFQNKEFTEINYNLLCWKLVNEFINKPLTTKDFFTFCVTIAKFAGYSHLHCINNADEYACKVIIHIARYVSKTYEIADRIWFAMQDFAENPDIIDAHPVDLRNKREVAETMYKCYESLETDESYESVETDESESSGEF